MKKKLLSIIMLTAIMINTCMVALAADNPNSTQNSLSSKGTICYQEGQETVVIDADDLYMLADRLDQFKVVVVEQLGELHTYLSRDSAGVSLAGNDGVYAGHLKPLPENAVDPVTLDFDEILQGIAASQSIPLEPSAYGLASDTKLYKGENGKLTTDQASGATQISIQAATAANLSAGTAAWVNGELLLGTGEDMAVMYDEKMQSAGSDEELGTYEITSGYTLPEDVKSAYAYVVTTAYSTGGSDGNHVGEEPQFTVTGGGHYTQLFSKRYARNGFNVRVGIYHVMNAPAGTVITGSNGLLFY
ncbi:MAG: hypothetical protein K2N00_07845 [Lachnospiraceae bacterium]|nr:hypothetical protein [Lachnospiraceae bacterium]